MPRFAQSPWAIDALIIINELNENGAHALPIPVPLSNSFFLDVDGDDRIGTLDALLVINFINERDKAVPSSPPRIDSWSGARGEGESTSFDLQNAPPNRISLANQGVTAGIPVVSSPRHSSVRSLTTDNLRQSVAMRPTVQSPARHGWTRLRNEGAYKDSDDQLFELIASDNRPAGVQSFDVTQDSLGR